MIAHRGSSTKNNVIAVSMTFVPARTCLSRIRSSRWKRLPDRQFTRQALHGIDRVMAIQSDHRSASAYPFLFIAWHTLSGT